MMIQSKARALSFSLDRLVQIRALTNTANTQAITLRIQSRRPVGNSSDKYFTVAMSEVAALTLANICLDVQIGICMFLHPSDILALRKACRHKVFVAQIGDLLL